MDEQQQQQQQQQEEEEEQPLHQQQQQQQQQQWVNGVQADGYWETSPQATVESTPIQTNIESNKAKLSRRLSNRPSLDDLRHKGVMCPFEVDSPTEAERLKKSIRAHTSEQLQWKIQQRPDRQTLVAHHILMDTASNPDVSPKLHEAQEQLKKKKLMDGLNSKLANRPGALEVAEKGYLPLSIGAHSLLRDGSIPFTKVADVPFHDTRERLLSSSAEQAPSPEEFSPPPSNASAASGASGDSGSVVVAAARKRGSGLQKVTKKAASNQKIEKFGSLTFHQYIPPGKEDLTANRCREDQQTMYLKIEDEKHKLMSELLTEVTHPGQKSAKSKGLEQLQAAQLREECRLRKLKVSGNKEQLARLLEPYRREIAEKYRLSSLLSPQDSSPQHGPQPQPQPQPDPGPHQLRRSSSSSSGCGLTTSYSSPNLASQAIIPMQPAYCLVGPLFFGHQQQQQQQQFQQQQQQQFQQQQQQQFHQQPQQQFQQQQQQYNSGLQQATFAVTTSEQQAVSADSWMEPDSAGLTNGTCATCPPPAMRSHSQDIEFLNQIIGEEAADKQQTIAGQQQQQQQQQLDRPPPSPMQLDELYSHSSQHSSHSSHIPPALDIVGDDVLRQLVPSPTLLASCNLSSVTSELLTPKTQEFMYSNLGCGMDIDLDADVFHVDT